MGTRTDSAQMSGVAAGRTALRRCGGVEEQGRESVVEGEQLRQPSAPSVAVVGRTKSRLEFVGYAGEADSE